MSTIFVYFGILAAQWTKWTLAPPFNYITDQGRSQLVILAVQLTEQSKAGYRGPTAVSHTTRRSRSLYSWGLGGTEL